MPSAGAEGWQRASRQGRWGPTGRGPGTGQGPQGWGCERERLWLREPQHRPGSVLCSPLWSVERGFPKEPPEAVKLGVKRLLPDWLLGEQRDH